MGVFVGVDLAPCDTQEMKALLIAVGLFLMFGGALAVAIPRQAVVFTSGPSGGSRRPAAVADSMTTKRSVLTGAVCVGFGFGFLVAGLFWGTPVGRVPSDAEGGGQDGGPRE